MVTINIIVYKQMYIILTRIYGIQGCKDEIKAYMDISYCK
ncbi:protein of unknown function [Tepidibacter aestuarii]|nr:protein of unknown function [Tepidibacter aestuarii]